MDTHKGLLARKSGWCAVCCAAVLLATAPAQANSIPLAPDTTGRLWSWGVLGSALFDLVADLVVLAIAGWLIGPFRRGFDARFLWWGGAIWVGGLIADAIAWNPDGSRAAMAATAAALIFAWNLLLAAVISKMVWWRVVALAAAIAVVTAPYFMPEGTRSQRGAARACISNLRQIIAAAKLYADDYGGVLPDVGSYDGDFCGNWTPGPFWGEAIRDYVRAGDEIFRCPSVSIHGSPSYGWNRHLSRCPEQAIEWPTTCPLAWDWVPGLETAPGIPLDPPAASGERGSETRWGYYPAATGVSKADMATACSRHLGGLIVGFMDGHAGFERPTRWRPSNPGGRFMPSSDGPMPWPPQDARGLVVTMYPRDPRAHGGAGGR